LVGHSRGGEGVLAAEAYNNLRDANTRHNIRAITGLGTTDNYGLDSKTVGWTPKTASYLLLTGGLDDQAGFDGYQIHERAYGNDLQARQEKMEIDVYGANHNYFNTVWTQFSGDDAANVETQDARLTPETQQSVAQRILSAFFRYELQDSGVYKEVFTGDLKLSALSEVRYFPSYQGKDRMTVDNFEQGSLQDQLTNGRVTYANLTVTPEEKVLARNAGCNGYSTALPKELHLGGCTKGVVLKGSGGTYSINLPEGKDVSGYRFLSFKVAKIADQATTDEEDNESSIPSAGNEIYLQVYLVDGAGNAGVHPAYTYYYDVIPHPQQRTGGAIGYPSNVSTLTGIDIPLSMFYHIHAGNWEEVQNGGDNLWGNEGTGDMGNVKGVNLKDVRKIVIKPLTDALIAIDEIEFTK